MKKCLVFALILSLLLAAACASTSDPQPDEETTPTFDQELSVTRLDCLEYRIPMLNSLDSETLNGEKKNTYTFEINGQKAALEVRSSADAEAFKEYLPANATLRTINGTEWGVGAVVDNGLVTYNCRTTYDGRVYLVHAEEPEDLYFFESQILPGLVLASVA